MSYYVTNENSFLDIKNAHLRVTGNVHTDVLKVGSIGFQPAGSNISGTVNFTNVTTGVTTTSNLNVGGTLNLGTIELSASTHTLDHITARGNVTSTTVQFDNAHTSLVTSGNVEVGGELTVSGGVVSNVNLLSVSNVASIKKDSNVVTEFPRSKKLIKYPRVAMTNSASGGYEVDASTEFLSNYIWKAFDQDSNTVWHAAHGSTLWNSSGDYVGSVELITGHKGDWITLKLPTNERISPRGIRVFPRGLRPTYSAGQAPKDVVVIGSNDGSSWNVITTTTLTNYSFGISPSTNTPDGEEHTPATFDFEATEYYQYVGIIIKSIYTGGHTNPSISQLEFLGVPEYDPEAHGTDVVVKSVANVPNTDWLEVYYDAKDLADGTTTVNDLKPVGTAINGTANGNTTVSNGAFTFDEADDYITLDTGKTGNYIFSVSLWFKSSGNSVETLFHMNGDYATNNTVWLYGSGTSLSIDFVNNNYSCDTGKEIADNIWHHASFVYNGNGESGRDIYLDGIRLGGSLGGSNAGDNLNLTSTSSISRIGALNHSSGIIHEFKGSIANFRLFNRAITSDEVWQLYAYQKEYFGHGDLSMTLKAGRLGIGTSEPRAMLDVQGGLDVTGDVNIPSGRFTTHRFMGSGSGTFEGSGNITLPFNLDYGPGVNPNIGWEIRLAFGASGTNYGKCSISGCYDNIGTLTGVSEAFSLQLRTNNTNWTDHGSECFLSRRETVAPAYQAIIRIVNPLAENIPPPSSGTSIRWHFSYECTGCYASSGATTIRGGGYFLFGAADRRIKRLILNSATGSISGHYNFVAIS